MGAPRFTLKVTLALRQKAFVTLLFWLIYGLILIDSRHFHATLCYIYKGINIVVDQGDKYDMPRI